MRIKQILQTSILLFMGFTVCAQSKMTISNVYSIKLQNSGPILAENQIKGYYFFYQSDRIDRKTNEYTLQILDENLNKAKDIKFTDSKDIYLLESSFNGDAIVFCFFDDDQNTLDYRLYKLDGKKSYNYTKTLDKSSERYFKQQLQMNSNEESTNNNVFDISGKGFISVSALREDRKYTYDISFYSSEKRKSWTYNPIEDGKYTTAQYLGANDSVAVFEVLSKEKLMSKETESSLVGINIENGRKVFQIRTQDGKNQLYPMNIAKLNDGSSFLLVGPYYANNDRVLQDNSEGLGIWQLNNQGKLVKSKYVSWNKDMSRYLKVDSRGRVGDLGYVYFHKLIQTSDGNIFAVGEGYKKVADGVGIALNVLSGSYSAGVTKLKITDMLMLQLNNDFELKNAKIFEKNNNNFSLNTGSDFASAHTLALYAKAFDAFDYAYTQVGSNNESFVSGYMDYERSKDYSGLTFNAISYHEGKITTDKINLKTKASTLRVFPAKTGFVLISEYFKKDKAVELRLEKIN